MSSSINNIITASSSISLQQILPLHEKETILITDSATCDGRFVLYSIVAAVLDKTSCDRSSRNRGSVDKKIGRVLWLSCSPITEGMILTSLKKIGCDKSMLTSMHCPDSNLHNHNDASSTNTVPNHQLTIRSIPTLIENKLMDTDTFDAKEFAKEIYCIIKDWLLLYSGGTLNSVWVLIDDVSALSSLIGERLTHGLLLSIKLLVLRDVHLFSLVLRCSNDFDIDEIGLTTRGSNISDWLENKDADADQIMQNSTVIPWERSLVEIADSLIDIVPLSSGFSRDVHGRLLLTTSSTGNGPTLYNYCLTDTHVNLLRLNSHK